MDVKRSDASYRDGEGKYLSQGGTKVKKKREYGDARYIGKVRCCRGPICEATSDGIQREQRLGLALKRRLGERAQDEFLNKRGRKT